jgi:hypothetical protein
MKKKLFFVAAILGISLAVLGLSLLSNQGAAIAAEMDGDDEAVIIVQKSATSSQSGYKISFTAPITGLAALQETGLVIVTKDYGEMGIAVCSIDGVGCPADDCFCDPDGKSWSYFHWEDDQWEASAVGASSAEIIDGAVDGWYWGAWGDKPSTTTNYYFSAYSALDWLKTQQKGDGGFGSDSASVEAMLSIGAADIKASDWVSNTKSLMDYFDDDDRGKDYSENGGAEAGKLGFAVDKSQGVYGADWKTAMQYYNDTTGKFGEGAGRQSWGMLGTAALDEGSFGDNKNASIPAKAVEYLVGLQKDSGGWEWESPFGEDTNTTSLAIQALIAAGEAKDSEAVVKGLNWLKSAQNDDGGFPYNPTSEWGTDSDISSTAYVIQAIMAAGQDPLSLYWQKKGNSPISYMLDLQNENGSFPGYSELVSTQQAIPALFGEMGFTKYNYLPLISR